MSNYSKFLQFYMTFWIKNIQITVWSNFGVNFLLFWTRRFFFWKMRTAGAETTLNISTFKVLGQQSQDLLSNVESPSEAGHFSSD